MRLLPLALAALLWSGPALAAPRVITSVVPVHGIVSAVMGKAGTPELLLDGKMGEHRAAFTPQQIAALGEADLVFIIGEGLEAKLSQLSGSEAVNGKHFIALARAPGVRTYPVREGGAWEAHAHEAGHDDGDGHDHAEGVLAFDPHVWLDPFNAKAMAVAVARALIKADPENGVIYMQNVKAFTDALDAQAARIEAELAPVRSTPYVVFHDAFQYFEKRFGLSAAGAIADVSAKAPSARRLGEIRAKISEVKAVCVFREPQYDGKVVATVIEGTGAREGVLDPIGADITPGPDAYQQLLSNMAASLRSCLAG